MSKRPTAIRRQQTQAIRTAALVECEQLEQRRLLSAIVWTNRGVTTGTNSDRVADVFGTTEAPKVRSLIDAVLQSWARVVSNFNYPGGGNTYSITIQFAASGTSLGANAGSTHSTSDGKPDTGAMTIGRGDDTNGDGIGDGGRWFYDSTPFDNSEFRSSTNNGFAGYTTDPTSTAFNKADMYEVVAHEMGHALGLGAGPKMNAVSTNTGVTDTIDTPASNPPSKYWRFDGAHVRTLQTSYDSGGQSGGPFDANGSQHHAPAGASVTVNSITYLGSDDLMTPYYQYSQRRLISDTDAWMLADAYGYSVTLPSTFGTFYNTLDSDGTLRISTPGAGSDTIYLNRLSNGDLQVSLTLGSPVAGADITNAIVSTYLSPSVQRIVVDAGGGGDFIRLENTTGKPVTVNGGDGDDFIDFSFNARNLDNLNGSNAYVTGGNGYDQIYAYDNNSTLAKAFTITSARFDRGGWGGFFYASDLEALNLTTGTAADFVTVQSTYTNQPIWLNSAGGADQVTVGNQTNGVQSIAADVNIANSPSFTALTITDFGDSTARNYNIDFNGPSSFGKINNLAPARIIWTAADLSGLRVETGSGADSGIVYSNNVPITFDSTGGTDNLQIGDAAVGGAQFILKPITVTNHANFTALTVSDSGDATARTATIQLADSSTGSLTGLTPAAITWKNLDTFGIDVVTGNAADTVNIISDSRGVSLDSAGGNDTINIGSASGARLVTGGVDVRNHHGQSAINVNDTGDTTARTVAVSYNSFGVLQGLMASTLNWIAAETSLLSLTTGSGNDTINVASMAAALALSSAGGADTLNIGNATNGLAGIANNISVQNPPNFTTLNITDTANTAGRTWLFTSDGVNESIGISPTATISYKLADTLPGPINLSNGPDDVRVKGVDTRALNLNGNNGNDVFTIGSAANTVDPINIALGIDGGAGTDSLIFNNAGDTTEAGFTVTANVVSEPDMATTTFSTCESLEVRGGTGAAPTHTFNNTPAGVAMTILPGSSKDLIRTTGNGDWLTVKPSLGFDDVSVNDGLSAAGGKVKFDTTINLGTLTVKNVGNASTVAGAGMVVSAKGLSITGSGVLDLNDNDMILDYTSGPQVAAVQALINSARAGGAWTGAGITSTSAKNANPKKTTLAALEATDYKAVYGASATFDGQAIDTTAVLVKYTYYGDADFNGVVNFDDYSRTDAGFNFHRSGWVNGDFDGNGAVNFDDYSLLDLAFNTQGSPLRPGTRAGGVTIGELAM